MKQEVTQAAHLQLIRARCVELLEIAEKRTAGAWMKSCFSVFTDSEEAKRGVEGHHIADCDPSNDKYTAIAQADATFIASCAGAAEAGWKATIAMIDCVSLIIDCLEDCENHTLQSRELETAKHFAFEIAAAWPLSLLQP